MSIASQVTSLVTAIANAINSRPSIGPSDYQMWIAQGNTGTLDDYRAAQLGAEQDFAAQFTSQLGSIPTGSVGSESVAGITQLATSAEAITGTNAAKALSPARVVDLVLARRHASRSFNTPCFEPSSWEPTAVAGGVRLAGTIGKFMLAAGWQFDSPGTAASITVPLTAPASGGAWFLVCNRVTWNTNGTVSLSQVAIAGPTQTGTAIPVLIPFTRPAINTNPGTIMDVPIAWALMITGNTTPQKISDVRLHRSGDGTYAALDFFGLAQSQQYLTYGAKVAVLAHTLPSGGVIRRGLFILVDGNNWQAHGDISVDRSTTDPTTDLTGYFGTLATVPGPILFRTNETRIVDPADGYRATFIAYGATWHQDNPAPIYMPIGTGSYGAGFTTIGYQTVTGRSEAVGDGYIAPRDGYYLLHAFLRWADNPGGNRNIGICFTTAGNRDETVVNWQYYVNATGVSANRFSSDTTRLVKVTKGTKLGFQVFVDGGSLSTSSGYLEVTPIRDY